MALDDGTNEQEFIELWLDVFVLNFQRKTALFDNIPSPKILSIDVLGYYLSQSNHKQYIKMQLENKNKQTFPNPPSVHVQATNLVEENQNNNFSSTKDYYQTLTHYHRPSCFGSSNTGTPFFLVNDRYPNSFPCLIVLNVIFSLMIVLSLINPTQHGDQNFQKQLNNVNILILVLINITFLLTLFMNPGIISPEEMSNPQDQLRFCDKCSRMVSKDMEHCKTCEVCVQDLDHHCDFFGKCIAGKQRFAFYGFITFIFIGFLSFLALATTALSDN